MKIIQTLSLIAVSALSSVMAMNSNPPTWPAASPTQSGVIVNPSQAQMDAIFANQGGQTPPNNGQFSPHRYAFLFTPGTHNVNVNVGFYTSVIGLGTSPSATTIQNVTSMDGDPTLQGGALDNFWRSAENFTTTPSLHWAGSHIGMTWAVSQAAPMRRVTVNGDLYLFQIAPPTYAGAYASGGFMADCQVSGKISPGSQQQWFTRNTSMGSWTNSVWNMVFLGCAGAVPATACGSACSKYPTKLCNAYTTVQVTPIIAEKPYISYDPVTLYSLNLPNTEKAKTGPTKDYSNVISVNFTQVYVTAATDTEVQINQAIEKGYHVVLSPGVYNLTGSINVNKKGICILGIGFPTMVSTTGVPCIVVQAPQGSANVPGDGTRIAGILLQAGIVATPQLFYWEKTADSGYLYDCFARVGGPTNSKITQVQAATMVQIDCDNVVCDNLWLWRADHDIGGLVKNQANPCNNGFIVNGNNVTAYGLAVEHTLQDLTVWNGENGQTYFYQAEFPYDVTPAYGTSGYAGYRVAQNVTKHQAYGVGVYCFFRDNIVHVPSGISAPLGSGINFTNSLTKFLTGNGGINNVINALGTSVSSASPAAPPSYVCGPHLSGKH